MKSANKTFTTVFMALLLLTLLMPFPSINISSDHATLSLSPSNVHRGIIGSYPNGTLWEIAQTTIAENMTLTIDKIILYDNAILTLKNCTIYTSDGIDYTTIKFNNHTHLYVYNCSIRGIYPDGLYQANLFESKFVINMNIIGSKVDAFKFEYDLSTSDVSGYIYLTFLYTVFNSFYYKSDVMSDVYYKLIIKYCYLYNVAFKIISPTIAQTVATTFVLQDNIWDNSQYLPEQPNLPPLLNLVINYYINMLNIENQFMLVRIPGAVSLILKNNSFVNFKGIYISESDNFNHEVSQNLFTNCGLVAISSPLVYGYIYKQVQFPIVYSMVGSLYTVSLPKISIKNISCDTTFYIASDDYANSGYHFKFMLEDSNINILSTMLTSGGMGFCDITDIYINNSVFSSISLAKNYSYKDIFNNPVIPTTNLYINNCDIDSMMLDNFTNTTIISSSTINQYAIFKNSNITMHSTTFNSLQTFNSTVRADYALTITINSIENTITHITNKTGTEVYTTSQKHFTVRLPSFYIDNATDSIAYYYPYKVIVEALSDTGEALINPFLSDQNIVISIGTVKLTLVPRGMRDYGWVLIPMPTDREVSAFALLRSSNSIRALVYEIAGTFIYLYKAADGTIYGHDFQIRPYTAVFIYITSQEVEIYLDAVYGNFNDTTLKVHVGYNLIAIPITLTVAEFFAYNPAITEITLYNDTGYYTYHKYDSNLNQIYITPERGFIVKCVSSSAYIKLHG